MKIAMNVYLTIILVTLSLETRAETTYSERKVVGVGHVIFEECIHDSKTLPVWAFDTAVKDAERKCGSDVTQISAWQVDIRCRLLPYTDSLVSKVSILSNFSCNH